MREREMIVLHRKILTEAAMVHDIQLTSVELEHLVEASVQASKEAFAPRVNDVRPGEVSLTDHDVRILLAMSSGLNGEQGARQVGVSRGRLDYSVRKSHEFFLVGTTPQAINAAYERGMVEPPSPLLTLTHGIRGKELQLLRLLATDADNKALNGKMAMSDHDRAAMQRRVCVKLGAKNRAHAVRMAWDYGIFTRSNDA